MGSVTLCLVPSMPLHDHLAYDVEIKVLVCVFQVRSVPFFSDAASLRVAKQEALLCLVSDGKERFGPSSEGCGGMQSILVAFVFSSSSFFSLYTDEPVLRCYFRE